MLSKILLILFVCVVSSFAADSVENVYTECGTNVQCAEKRFVALIDEFDAKEKIDVLDGSFAIVKKTEVEAKPAEEDLIQRVTRFITEHEIRFQLPQNAEAEARGFATDSRSSKLKKIILPLILLLKLKAVILLPIIITIIGLVAFKGLGAALAALSLSAFSMLKSLLDGKSSTQRVTYGIISAPYPVAEPHWSRTADYADLDPYYRTLPHF